MREEFSGEVIGLDQGTILIEAAQEIAKRKAAGVNNLRFEVGDCHSLAYNDNTFNIVVAHTLVSHVNDVERTVQELVRVTKPGGVIAIIETLVMPYAEVGQAKYWKSLGETYSVRIAPLGLLPQTEVDKWMKQALDKGTFFGMSNYFTYIAHKKG